MLRDGARYHVTIRANRREMIFAQDDVKRLFVSTLKEAKHRFDFNVENVCIMENHVHFILRPALGESLSVIMQWMLSVFAIRYNKRFGLTGHVWGERFYSKIIESMCEYIRVFTYIDENPFTAKLVTRAEDWLYGRFHLDEWGDPSLLSGPSWADWP